MPTFAEGEIDAEAREPESKWPVGLALGALGVVYGDLGTNPLFALGEAFEGEHPIHADPLSILGVLSLIFWCLALVTTLKYLTFVMRAANDGEGGILALLGLIPLKARPHFLILVVIFGASLLCGEGVVTPAISVLSAVEGLKAVSPGLTPWIVPITIAILLGLFFVQRRGTEQIGFLFGPVMVVWFLAIGGLGAAQIERTPIVLTAVSPLKAIAFATANPREAFIVLGAVILCVAGSEALYADMGHFGRRPIAMAWYGLVMPALLLNYFGQGALMLSGGKPEPSAFYALVPHALLFPMIALSAAATVIASQALISGAYSLTQQAVQLGFSPRVTIVHTSAEHSGQIYIPEVNWALMIACVALVVGFQSSDRLAAAYGMSVAGTMTVTTLAYFVMLRRTLKWPIFKAAPLCLVFIAVDLTLLAANLRKFADGGWIPFTLGLGVFTIFTTWMRGRKRLAEQFRSMMVPLDAFLEDVRSISPPRIPGVAVFLTANTGGVPLLLLHQFKHIQALHQKVVLLTIANEQTPFVKPSERFETEDLGQGFHRLIARFGFMETPNVPSLLEAMRPRGLDIDLARTTYFLGRETLIPSRRRGMARWRKILFAFVSRNAKSATAYFGIPVDRVVELGMQIEL